MSLAIPIALTLAALALPIIALYILKVRLRRVPVSTNLFWKQIYEEKPPRSIWQHFRHLLSLLLQLLLLLLIVLAIADPYFSWQALQARRIVLVIDNSASMRCTDASPTRLEAAKSAALDVVNGLRFRDEVAVVLAGHTPQVLVGLSGHLPTLRAAIDGIRPTDNDTWLEPAIELGSKLIGEHRHGQVMVFTDGCVTSATTEPATSEQLKSVATVVDDNPSTATPLPSPTLESRVIYRLVGSDTSNIGITQFQTRRSLTDPLGYEILASVKNASSSAVKCRLELTLNDLPVDVLPLTLQPDELWTRSLEKTTLEGGRLKAELTSITTIDESQASTTLNGLTVDDAAFALLPARVTQPVLLVTAGNLFLQKVFEANPLVEVTVLKQAPEQWPTNGIIVIHGSVPTNLPVGKVFIVDPIGSCDAWDQGDVVENPIVTEQDKTSPLMTHIRLDNVVMPKARAMTFKMPVKSLASTLDGHSVFAEIKRDNGKCLVLNVNLDESDLAFRTAFPIMASNALAWFAGESGELQPSLSTGAMTTIDVPALPPGVVPRLKAPDGELKTQQELLNSADGSKLLVGPLNQVGVWTSELQDGQPSLKELAVNLSNLRESDLRPSAALQSESQVAATAGGLFSRPIWFTLILIACVLLSVEWFLYQRRFIS